MHRPLFRSVLFLFCTAAPSIAAEASPDAFLAEVVTGNPELRFYEAELAAARASVRIAAAPADPEFSIEAGHKRVHTATGTLAGEGTAWSVSLSQTFAWPGRLALRKAIADREVELAELGLARFKAALAARTRTLVHGLHAAHTKADAAAEVAERFAALRETFLARDPAGLSPLLETRVIEARELALQRRATEAQLALHAALVELNQLRGQAVEAPLRIAGTPLVFQSAPTLDALLASAWENNFELRARELELEQQGYAVRLARNERRAGVTLSPFYSQEKAGDRETVVGLGLSVPLPITARGRASIELAAARQRQAEASVLIAHRELEREVTITARAFTTKLAEIQRWSPDSVTKFREAAALADRHYRLGSVSLATYTELQESYLDAVDALLDTQREILQAGLQLELLTGLEFHPVKGTP